MSTSDTSFLSQLKPKGGLISAILSAVFLIGSWLIQYGGQKTHQADDIKQLQTDVASLKSELANDTATRREVDALKSDTSSRLDRIENKLDKEIAFHHPK